MAELCGELMQRNLNKEGTETRSEKGGSIFGTSVKKSGGLFGKPDEQSAQRPAFGFGISDRQSGSILGLPNGQLGQMTSSFGGLFKQSEQTRIFGSMFWQPVERPQQTGSMFGNPFKQPNISFGRTEKEYDIVCATTVQ